MNVSVTGSTALPRILFFNINGSGLGHLSTCLAYALRVRERARPVFFSLASAIELIAEMGFEADYFVSPFWSRSTSRAWNRQLAPRLGMVFERIQPEILVFDGTWPFQGLLDAARAYGIPKIVWSNLLLYKENARQVPFDEKGFDLVIRLGEIGTRFEVKLARRPGRKVHVPPVTLLPDKDILDRSEARASLGLQQDGRYALFSLGPGNLKDVSDIARGLADDVRGRGYTVVWAKPPISVRDVWFPDDVVQVTAYPLARYMRAFDIFAGAAGYNTCCEVVQSGVPSLLVPNTQVIDDQAARARAVGRHMPVVVSACETPEERAAAVARLLQLPAGARRHAEAVSTNGADLAALEILRLLDD